MSKPTISRANGAGGDAIAHLISTGSTRPRTSSRPTAGDGAILRLSTSRGAPHRTSSAKKRNGRASTQLPTNDRVPVQPSRRVQPADDLQRNVGATREPSLPELIALIRELWRRRQAWHRAEKSLTLQAKALCRRLAGGDKTAGLALYKATIKESGTEQAVLAAAAIAPLIAGRAPVERSRAAVEKQLTGYAKRLPVAGWIEEMRGVGLLSLAGIVGEAGDIGSYRGPACLWKRMGLAVIDGRSQRKVSDVKQALVQGYSPARRSLMWTIGDCIIKARGPLREPYEIKKEEYLARGWTKLHSHRAAKRYIEKRLLRDLWRAWRGAIIATPPTGAKRSSHPSTLFNVDMRGASVEAVARLEAFVRRMDATLERRAVAEEAAA